MAHEKDTVMRVHALHRLLRLTPENTDIEALDRFVCERAEILAELESIQAPWTAQEQEILEAAMSHAERIMADLETLHRQIAEQIGGLRGAAQWGACASNPPQPRVKRRY